ncbi:MAG: sugar ABC transporter substrate-binding protein [Lachnospiraceae bacterium]|nr:sugar ABC transporter substrate-binding protein [Lachnospiraceae bacterium]
MKLRKLTALLMAGLMTASLAACGEAAPAPAASEPAAEEPAAEAPAEEAPQEMGGSVEGELNVTIWDENQRAGLQEIVDDWSATSGVKATIQVVNWDNYWTLLEAGASGGELPDVFWMHSNVAQKYMENDMLMDMTDKIAASDKIDLSNYYEGIVDLYSMDGKNYAVPKDIDTIALWYNKTMFDEAGVAYPDDTWTWADLAEAAKKLTTADHWGYAIAPSNNQDSFYNVVYSYGGNIISDDKKKSGWDDPKTIEAMELITGMIKDGSCPDLTTLADNGADVLFTSGKTAMVTQGSWMLAAFRDNEYTHDNCDVAVLPYAKDPSDRTSIYNGLGWAAAANGKNLDAAWSLIEYLGSKEAQEKQAELGVTMSAYKGCSDKWVNSVDCFDLKGHMDMLNANLVFRPYSRSTVEWENMQTEKLQDAWSDPSKTADVCKDIAAAMNDILAEE